MVRDGKFSDGRETPVGGQGFFRVFLFRNFTIELPFAMAKGLLNYALRITNYALKVSPINSNLKSRASHKKCRQQAAFLFREQITCSPCSPWCSRTAGSRYRSWSCKRTGRKSGTRRSHPSLRSRTGCGSQWS